MRVVENNLLLSGTLPGPYQDPARAIIRYMIANMRGKGKDSEAQKEKQTSQI